MLAVRQLGTVVGCLGFSLMLPALQAASILSGTVSQSGSLYTYSYALDDTSGPGPIDELNVRVNSLSADLAYLPQPVNTTSPPGSSFRLAFSGSIGNPPYNEYGGFYAWGVPDLAVGQTLSGFSFTTTAAPAPGGNKYFLFCPSDCGAVGADGGIVEYGFIVAPDFRLGPPPVPEPNFFWPVVLFIGGIVTTAIRRRRC